MMKVFETIPQLYKRCDHALDGLKHLVASDSNYIKHLLAAATVISVGLVVGLSRMEWIMIIFCIGLVLTMEAFNSALENLSDKITTEYDCAIKLAKDIAAGGVLVSALTALAVGLIIFVPKFNHIIQIL